MLSETILAWLICWTAPKENHNNRAISTMKQIFKQILNKATAMIRLVDLEACVKVLKISASRYRSMLYILEVLQLWFDVIDFHIRLYKYSLPYVYLGVIEVHFWFTKREGKPLELLLLPFSGYNFPSTVHNFRLHLLHHIFTSFIPQAHEWTENEIH